MASRGQSALLDSSLSRSRGHLLVDTRGVVIDPSFHFGGIPLTETMIAVPGRHPMFTLPSRLVPGRADPPRTPPRILVDFDDEGSAVPRRAPPTPSRYPGGAD